MPGADDTDRRADLHFGAGRVRLSSFLKIGDHALVPLLKMILFSVSAPG